MPILPICIAISADAERVKYALDGALLQAADGTRQRPPDSGALDDGALLTAEDGTRRSLSGSAERDSAGKSRRQRSGPGGVLSSSSGQVSGEPLLRLAKLLRRRLGGRHVWSESSAFGDLAMTGLIVRVARSLTDPRAAHGEVAEELEAAAWRRRTSAGESSCRVSGDCQRSWRVVRVVMLVAWTSKERREVLVQTQRALYYC